MARHRPRPLRLRRLGRPVPLVAQTEKLLREAIARGRLPGNRLPSAAELAEQLGVSRETVRLAQGALQRDGLLVKYRRKGTFLQPGALSLKEGAAPSTLIGYLAADYPSAQGEEAVTREVGSRMLEGALREAGRSGFSLVVGHAPHTEMDAAFDRLCRTARLRGIIFASCGEEKIVRRALGMGLPAVLLDHDLQLPQISSVREDSVQAGRVAVAHLAGLGHRRIAFAPWRLIDLNPWRLRGYREGLREARLPRRHSWEIPVELTPRGARELVGRLLALRPMPTALLCFNNTFTRFVVEELRRRKVRVPGEMSVMGGGGEAVPGVACHQADWLAMGRRAVQVILRALQKDRSTAAPEHHLFPHKIVRGRTAGAAP